MRADSQQAIGGAPAVEAAGVRYSYDGAIPVLQGVDLQVRPGEFLCILGGNGSGKSTFAKHLNALLRADAGSVQVFGMDASDPAHMYDIRSSVGMVFQNPDDQIVATLVENDVAFGPENLGVPQEELQARVAEALEEVGLVGFEKRETHALSGGQKQRVAIAGALAMRPSMLVLDEASAMLDPRGRAGLMRVCRELNQAGISIVMITHIMEEAVEADRVAVIDAGRVVLQGTPEEVFAQAERLEELNLEVPAPVKLGIELRRRGIDAGVHVREADMVEDVLARAAFAQKQAGRRFDLQIFESAPATAQASAGTAGLGEEIICLNDVSFSYEPSVRERSRRRAKAAGTPKAAKWGSDPNEVWALRHVDLAVRKGDFLGVAGHTGSGKSTLIQLLNGLSDPTEGTVTVAGQDISNKKASLEAKRAVGVVFQYPEHQLFAETVFDDVAFGPRNLGLSEDEVARRVRSAMENVGLSLDALGAKSPFELSGGQQRRVAFAGVLSMEPQVLVLDEPAAGLDPASRKSFLGLIERLHEQGLTVVMVSHSMDDLADLCDRIVVLNEGRVATEGTPAEVFQDADALKAVGLGLPATQRMAAALRGRMELSAKSFFSAEALADAIAQSLGAAAPQPVPSGEVA